MQLCWMADILTLDLMGTISHAEKSLNTVFSLWKAMLFCKEGQNGPYFQETGIITWRLQSKGTASSHRFDLCVYLIRAFPKWAGFQKWHIVRRVGGSILSKGGLRLFHYRLPRGNHTSKMNHKLLEWGLMAFQTHNVIKTSISKGNSSSQC